MFAWRFNSNDGFLAWCWSDFCRFFSAAYRSEIDWFFYLIWLGIKMWLEESVLGELQEANSKGINLSMFWSAYVVTALNPKGIIFFVAFVPQFINPRLPVLKQFIILEVTFVILAAINVAIWALLAGQMRSKFQSPKLVKRLNKVGGGFLVGVGLVTATLRQ